MVTLLSSSDKKSFDLQGLTRVKTELDYTYFGLLCNLQLFYENLENFISLDLEALFK